MSLFAHLLEHNRYLNLVGILLIMGIAYLCSRHKRQINYKLVVNALVMQFGIAYLALKTAGGQYFLETLADGVGYLYKYAFDGVSFLFGSLAQSNETAWGVIFAVQILPMIIFFGAFMSLLFYLGIVQRVVGGLGLIVRPILGTTGAETLCAIANSFLGQTEAPLLIRHYLKNMTKSEMLVVMVSGMGTISGSILAIYASMGAPIKSLLTASVMAIPATIMIAKILLPETEKVEKTDKAVVFDNNASNVFDAISTGTSDGLQLALNVAAMLLSFIALMAMVNGILGGFSTYLNLWFGLSLPVLSLDAIFAQLFYPFAYLLGFTGTDAIQVAELLGTKVGINEFLAYYKMVHMDLPVRVQELTTYALCGFSNFSCIGIQVGGIGVLVPEKRHWLTELGLTAVLGGALSNLLTAMVAGLFI